MQRSLAELRNECRALNLNVVQLGRKEAKKDYIKALQKHFWPQNPSKGLLYRMSIESPQLAFLFTNLRQIELDNIYESDNITFEKKEDGVRMIITYFPEEGFGAYGRNLSVSDYLPVPYGNNILFGYKEDNWENIYPSFVIDAEVVSTNPNISTEMGKRGVITETPLQAVAALLSLNSEDSIRIQTEMNQPLEIRAFDCLMYNDMDLREEPYFIRRKFLQKVIDGLELGFPVFKKVKSVVRRKEEYLHSIWDQGGEGIIAKPIDMPYLNKNSRPRKGWVKIKRTASGFLADTVDGFVTGFELGKKGKGFENLVATLSVSIFLETDLSDNGAERIHLIAKVPNLPLDTRKKFTVLKDGKPSLREDIYRRVVEIEGQAISARANRLVHPRLIRWRDDKNFEDCRMRESDLKRLVL